jgi:hypothetical protein
MFNEVERYDEKIWCEKKESGISSANLQARFLSAAKATHYVGGVIIWCSAGLQTR